MEDLYTENYKTLMQETEEDTNKWKDIPCLWIRRINIVKISILSKAIYRFSAISIKIPVAFFQRYRRNDPKFSMEPQTAPSDSQSNLEKEEQSWRDHTS